MEDTTKEGETAGRGDDGGQRRGSRQGGDEMATDSLPPGQMFSQETFPIRDAPLDLTGIARDYSNKMTTTFDGIKYIFNIEDARSCLQ